VKLGRLIYRAFLVQLVDCFKGETSSRRSLFSVVRQHADLVPPSLCHTKFTELSLFDYKSGNVCREQIYSRNFQNSTTHLWGMETPRPAM